MQKNTLFLLLSILFFNLLQSQNLVVNGDFESGGVGVGFNINSSGYTYLAAPTGTTAAGNYAFGVNPYPYNTSNFISGFDHTTGTGTGKMMIIDGSTDGGNPSFWKAGNTGGGICGLTVGTTYTFSFWIKSISTNVTGTSTQADVRVVFNNATVVTSPASTLASLPAAGWVKKTYTITPTNACVNIELRNYNTNPVGNDFAIDDITLTPPPAPLALTYSFVNYSCATSNDGAIALYATGGTAPYTYSITGPTSAPSNNTGFFPNLSAGTYTGSVVDATSTTVSVNNIVISPATTTNPLTISPNTSACPNSPTTLTVSGGTTYNWTASPTDATLTTPTLPTIIVSPTTTTTYTATSSATSTSNLIYNGDFSLGNTGFYTDYQFLNPTNTSGSQRAFGVVTNPSNWYSTFSNCTDHTGGGKMMVIDGSIYNSGNDKIWSQTIPVVANQNYTFSYWIQSVTNTNTASIVTKINGVTIGTGAAPLVSTCGNWTQYTYTWNSGTNTQALISLNDTNVNAAGNDFALDDISFTTNTTCNVSKSVQVSVIPLSITVPNNQTACNGVTIPTLNFTSNIPGTTFSWTNNNPLLTIGASGNGSSIAPILATNTTSSPIVATITVTGSYNGCTNDIKTFTITINPSPSVTVNNIQKCTGDQSPATITATPSTPGTYSYSWTVPGTATNPGNVASFNATVAGNYSVVITNTSTGCSSASSTGTFTYLLNCCPNDITIPIPATLCTNNSCTTLSASYIDTKDTTSYTVSSIPYNPVNINSVGVAATNLCIQDDAASSPVTLPFKFSYYGKCYTTFQVTTNISLRLFNGTQPFPNCVAASFPWAYTAQLPALAANTAFLNSIFFPMQDTDPRISGGQSPSTVSIKYVVTGVAPCRKMIVNVSDMGLYQCNQGQGLQESQVILYESTNIIDINIKKRTSCTGWNSGSGVIGLVNDTGTSGIAPPTRNTGTWTATNEAWRFTPSGASLSTFQWLNASGTVIGTTPNISVCPSTTTTYTAQVKYTECNNPGPATIRTVTKPVTVEVYPDDTQNPVDITQCAPNNVFNLTSNEPIVLGSLPSGSYDISYYTSQADAQNSANPIADPVHYISTGQTIYMALQSSSNICVRVKAFNLVYNPCTPCPTITNPIGTQTLCIGGNPTPFTVTTTFTGANSISYVYFNSAQTGSSMYSGGTLLGTATPNGSGIASYDAPILGTAGSLPNIAGTYYVYAIANPAPSDPTCRPYQEIIVTVNPILSPSLSCGIGTVHSVTFNWLAVPNATSYTATYTINSGTPTAVSNINNVLTYTVSSLNPNDSVCITITPVGGSGTCFASSSLCCTANPCIPPTVTVNNSTVCQGQSATVTATPGTAGTYSYAWSGPYTTNPGNVASFTTTIAGTYTVTITDTTTNCSGTGSGTVTVNPNPTVTVNSPTVCQGQSATVTATPTPSGTYSYSWSGPFTTNPGNVASFTTTIAGTYSVIITDTTTSCVSASASGTVTVNPNPTVTVNNPTVCQGQSAAITASPLPAT
ncbi:hypothetical protein CLV55_11272, partial [Flavobacterium aciduliphilum]